MEWATFGDSGGGRISLDQVVGELEKLPLDGVLGFLAAVSADQQAVGAAVADARWQANYLNRAIVDDFPTPLPGASRMYAPGRVPYTGGRYALVHEQNMALLTHLALLHADTTSSADTVPEALQRRLCRLLLLCNDLLSARPTPTADTLTGRRELAVECLRHCQFNRFPGRWQRGHLTLARHHVLLADCFPGSMNLDKIFIDALGVSLTEYFTALSAFLMLLDEGVRPGQHWLSLASVFSQVQGDRALLEKLMLGWSTTPKSYREEVSQRQARQRGGSSGDGFDFVPLRRTPFIEARPGQLVCPLPQFVKSKAEDEPYFRISDELRTAERRQAFQSALGRAYHEYADRLVARIARGDRGSPWQAGRTLQEGSELCDGLLIRGDTAVLFEHKGQRPDSVFTGGGESRRSVLGPTAKALARLEGGHAHGWLPSRKQDEGLLTRPLWQIARAGSRLIAGGTGLTDRTPMRVFPIVTHLAEVRVNPAARAIYLDRLVDLSGAFTSRPWRHPEWLHVEDLEALAALADRGELDLVALLETKRKTAPKEGFDWFLHRQYPRADLADPVLKAKALELMNGAVGRFFPHLPAA